MARERREIEDDSPGGAPEWMVTFSDCMTLLLTFFVLLLSFASFGPKVLPNLGDSFADALPTLGLSRSTDRDSVWLDQQAQLREKVTKGSETRTLAEELTAGALPKQRALDFRNMKVFRVASSEMFWANGSQISKVGKDLLDSFIYFLHAVPSRVVISENGLEANNEIGLARSWAILEYMTENTRLVLDDFSITSSTMMRNSDGNERMVEITLLERSIYE